MYRNTERELHTYQADIPKLSDTHRALSTSTQTCSTPDSVKAGAKNLIEKSDKHCRQLPAGNKPSLLLQAHSSHSSAPTLPTTSYVYMLRLPAPQLAQNPLTKSTLLCLVFCFLCLCKVCPLED